MNRNRGNVVVDAGAKVVAFALAGGMVGVGAVIAATLVAGEAPGRTTWEIPPVAAAAVVGALAWPPSFLMASAALERLVRGAVTSPSDVLRALSDRRSRDLSDEELLDEVASSLARSTGAAVAEIWRTDPLGRLVRAVAVPALDEAAEPRSVPVPSRTLLVLRGGGVVGRAWLGLWLPELLDGRSEGEVRAVPLTHGDALLGVVLVVRRPDAPRFEAGEDADLAELGSRLGVVLHNRELDAVLRETLADLQRTNDELRASRVRLVSTADAERRRIERDLHDGAQQHLVALAVNLRLAEDAIAADPSTAHELFASLGEDLRSAINELRTLAHGIYPPLLMDSGLAEALRVAADRSPSSVTVSIGPVGRYAPEVEAAAYFCALEALQNAAKHAPGAAVRVELGEVDDTLRVTVEDDGPGLAGAAVEPGHGLANMADRVGAVGGSVEVSTREEGGARVEMRLPCARRASDPAPGNVEG